MRQTIFISFLVLIALTFVGLFYVLPEKNTDQAMIHAFWQMADEPNVKPLIDSYRKYYRDQYGQDWPDVTSLLAAEEELTTASGKRAEDLREKVQLLKDQEDRFRTWYNRTQSRRLDEIPRLVWGTDANPARNLQCQLFRRWHLEKYGEPIDIVTDPSTRGQTQTTKTIIQCIAGTGPDIIEVYGPAQLRQFVDSGIALDITEDAQKGGFGMDRVFPAARSSLAYNNRQYGFTCNVGYVVLLYHKDLFAATGITPPQGPWTINELISIGDKLVDRTAGRRRYAILGLHPWPMAIAAGSHFFNNSGTASFYNNPKTVSAFRAFQDLIYKYGLMPSPAESASMSAAGGFGESNIRLFIRKASTMVVGGRWDYATLAQYNRDHAIIPALDRQLARDDLDSKTRESLSRIRTALQVDVLTPLSDEDYDLMVSALTDEDRKQLLKIGVAHIPNVGGKPVYEVAGRVALVNRASPLAKYAERFIEFLASESYNEQINGSFDSICGMPEYCFDDDGISGLPRALPGLTGFDSPIFAEIMRDYAADWELSPFIGRQRFGELVGQVMDQLQNGRLSPAEAARICEDRINRQITANLKRDAELRAKWEKITGVKFQPEKPLPALLKKENKNDSEGKS